jgi:hypothetical protein
MPKNKTLVERHGCIVCGRIFSIVGVCTLLDRATSLLSLLHTAVPFVYNFGTDMLKQCGDLGDIRRKRRQFPPFPLYFYLSH